MLLEVTSSISSAARFFPRDDDEDEEDDEEPLTLRDEAEVDDATGRALLLLLLRLLLPLRLRDFSVFNELLRGTPAVGGRGGRSCFPGFAEAMVGGGGDG